MEQSEKFGLLVFVIGINTIDLFEGNLRALILIISISGMMLFMFGDPEILKINKGEKAI